MWWIRSLPRNAPKSWRACAPRTHGLSCSSASSSMRSATVTGFTAGLAGLSRPRVPAEAKGYLRPRMFLAPSRELRHWRACPSPGWTSGPASSEGNRNRDERNKRALVREGWKVLTIWECQLRDASPSRSATQEVSRCVALNCSRAPGGWPLAWPRQDSSTPR